ncbi:MAG: NADH-quinone oxidoreductase subunit D [Elusimicrobiota bacterium]
MPELLASPPLPSDRMFINLGPQHPSTHGVLRVGLTVEGEFIVKAEPDVGYLHRGIEKLCESRTYPQCVVLADRLDYVSAMTNELPFCLAAETLLGVEAPERAQDLRVIVCELNRIASHLLFFGTYGIDLGAFTPFLHAFREREMVLDLFEALCGGRLTYNYIRIGGVMKDLPEGWGDLCRRFLTHLGERLPEYDELLSFNPIFLDRTREVGLLDRRAAVSWGMTGPNLRASGVDYDLRKAAPYCGYGKVAFDTAVGKRGSCWDRYYCRVREMAQSARIVEQALGGLAAGPVMAKVPKVLKPPPGEAYAHVEASRGELGVYMVSDGGASPARVHVRAPSFLNLQVLGELLVGARIADVVAILGSVDIVLGECDR